jgi:hypothetical protein
MRVVLVCVGISIVAGVGYGLFLAQPGEKPKTTKATATKEAKPEYESVQGRYLMVRFFGVGRLKSGRRRRVVMTMRGRLARLIHLAQSSMTPGLQT